MTKSDIFLRLFFMLHKNNNMRHEIKPSKINTKQLNPDNDVRLSALKQLQNDKFAINSELRKFLRLDNETHGNIIKMSKIGKI
jgi:hypothetical protein